MLTGADGCLTGASKIETGAEWRTPPAFTYMSYGEKTNDYQFGTASHSAHSACVRGVLPLCFPDAFVRGPCPPLRSFSFSPFFAVFLPFSPFFSPYDIYVKAGGCATPRRFSILLAPVRTCPHLSAPVRTCPHLSARFRPCQPLISPARSFLGLLRLRASADHVGLEPVRTCPHLSAPVRTCACLPGHTGPALPPRDGRRDAHCAWLLTRCPSAIVPMRSRSSMPAENVVTMQHGHFSDWHGAPPSSLLPSLPRPRGRRP